MKRIIKPLLPLIFLFLFIFISPVSTLAQGTKDWNSIPLTTEPGTTKKCVIDEVATIQGVECLFYNVLQVIVFFAGIASFIMFIIGGYKYLFSENDPKKTASAASTLTMAVLGIGGVILSWLIISLIYKFTGVNVTQFSIPGWK